MRSDKEEKYLWAMSKEVDRELAREEKKMQAKKYRVVASAKKGWGWAENSQALWSPRSKGVEVEKPRPA